MPKRERMRAADAVWLQDSPQNMMVINAVFLTERMTAEMFRALFSERVLEFEKGERYDRFRKRIVRQGKKAYWEDDPSFDVANHIFEVDTPSVRTEADLQRYVGSQASLALREDRPRWQIQCINSFEEQSAFLIRIHHSMGDGVAMLPVMFSLLDNSGTHELADKPQDKVAKKKLGSLRQIAAMIWTPVLLVRKVLWIPDRSILHGPEPGGEKAVGWTGNIPLDDIKAVKNHFSSTVNDVLMASVAGAFRRYFLAKGNPVPEKVRVSMPVNVRTGNEPIRMENKFAVALLELPLGKESSVDRLALVKAKLDKLKRSLEPWILYWAVELFIVSLPNRASRWLINLFGRKCTCVATNVPGPSEEPFIGGRKVDAMMFWVPQRANVALGISILSLAGGVRVGLTSDTLLLPDPELFCRFFEEEFACFRDLVGNAAEPSSA